MGKIPAAAMEKTGLPIEDTGWYWLTDIAGVVIESHHITHESGRSGYYPTKDDAKNALTEWLEAAGMSCVAEWVDEDE